MRILQKIATNIYLKHLLSFFILFYFILFSLVLLFRFTFFDFNLRLQCRSFVCYSSFFFSLSSCFQTWTVYIQCNIHITHRSSQSVEEELRRESFSKTPQRVGFVVPSRVVVNTLKSSPIRIHDHVPFWFYNENQD